jgi:hypothetical protein
MVKRAALRVDLDRRLAVGIVDLRRDGAHVVRITDLVVVLDHQRLAVGQTEHHAAATRLILADGSDADASRQRQLYALQRFAALEFEKLHGAGIVQAHGDLILFFDCQQQRRLRLGQPGRLLHLARLQLGALKHGQHDMGKVEEDQGNGSEYRQTADGNVPTRHAVLEGTQAALALQGRGVEIDPQGIVRAVHGFVCQVFHARNLCAGSNAPHRAVQAGQSSGLV